MKTIFVRVLIVWFILGQIIYLCLPQLISRPPTELERESVHNPTPGVRAALEKELDMIVDYESKRTIGIVTLLLALDGLLLGCFWNFGAKATRAKARAED